MNSSVSSSDLGKEPCRSSTSLPNTVKSDKLRNSLPPELMRYEITQQEQKAIEALRQRLGPTLCTPRYTDVRICRFLRAREANIDHAEDMLRKEMQWRSQVNPEKIAAEFQQHPAFQTLLNYWPALAHGVDQYNVPLLVERFGAVDTAGLMQKANHDVLINFHIYCMEASDAAMSPVWETLGAPIGYVHIEDLEGLSMKHYSTQALSILKEISKIDDSYYPETLRKFFVINAPGVFKFFWKIAKGVLSKNTISKFEVVEKVDENTFNGVATKENLPKYLNGTCTSCPHTSSDCKFGGGKAPKIN